MSSACIGLFDSGIGGLSVARHVKRLLPDHPLVYLADSQFAPYGDKTPDEVRRRCEGIVEFLLAQGAKIIVVACNTATVHHIQALRDQYAVPFVGVEPGIKPAVLQSSSKRVGVMVTRQTAMSASLAAHIQQFAEQAMIKVQACPGLAEAVECLDLTPSQLLRTYVSEVQAEGVDHLVLGCTHYNFLTDSIRALIGPSVTLVDTGMAVARQVVRIADEYQLQKIPQGSAMDDRFFTSGDLTSFNQQLAALWTTGKVSGQKMRAE